MDVTENNLMEEYYKQILETHCTACISQTTNNTENFANSDINFTNNNEKLSNPSGENPLVPTVQKSPQAVLQPVEESPYNVLELVEKSPNYR